MKDEPVVILGAGPAGLAAAYECIKGDMKPIVIEKADKVGGIARTESYKGYCFDIGGHRFFTKIDMVNQLWQEMMGEHFLKVSRMSRIYYRGRFFNYPLNFTNAFFNLGVLESLLILTSYFRSLFRPYPEEKTFEQWVSNRFGRRLFKTFFQTYTEKVWGIPCNKIGADWAAQRIKGLSLIAAVSNALLGSQKAKSLISEFYYPFRGPGMMWQNFQEAIEAGGGQVRFNSEALRITHKNGRIVSIVCLEGNKKVELPVGHLISSIPITSLVSLLDPKVPEKILNSARQLSYRAFLIVGLIVDKKDLFPDQWIYVHSQDVKVGRIQNFKNWSPAMVPDLQKTSVGMEYFCDKGDEIWAMSDNDLADLGARELAYLGLAQVDDVIDSFVIRQPYAYPIYDHGYDKHLKVIRDFIGSVDNIQSIGRNGMHRYNNMDHSVQSGILAAQNIKGANHDLWEINEEGEYLEEDKEAKAGQIVPENVLTRTFARLDRFAFATAVGSVSGLLIFLATIWLVIKGGEVVGPNLRLLSQYFVGYTVTVRGAFIAFAYSVLWGFLFGWLFAYLRNLFLAFYIYRVKKKAELLSLKDFLDHV
jgi:protoporphyrinogen oxidase